MDRTLNIELSLDPMSRDFLPQYQKVLYYLMEHPYVSDEEKLGLKFCNLSIKRLQGLQQYYKGVFKVKDVMVLCTMKDYIKILVKNTVPSMTYRYFEKNGRLTVTKDGVLQLRTPEKRYVKTSAPTMEVTENRTCLIIRSEETYRIEEELDPQFKTEIILMAKEMESNCTLAKQVQTSTMSSVASSVTRQSTDVRKEKVTPMLNKDDC